MLPMNMLFHLECGVHTIVLYTFYKRNNAYGKIIFLLAYVWNNIPLIFLFFILLHLSGIY